MVSKAVSFRWLQRDLGWSGELPVAAARFKQTLCHFAGRPHCPGKDQIHESRRM